jgi:dipeptidyl aminopeptidase/acylaminoacyl peptidase
VADEGSQKRVYWNPKDKKLWFNAMRGGERVMMKVSPDGGTVEQATTSAHPFIDEPCLSKDGNLLAYIGMSPDQPNVLYLNSKNRERIVLDPNAGMLPDFEFGNYSDRDFVNSRGDTIEGWLYYPPDFSPDKTWPLVVYYYGGVSPRDLRFSVFYQFLLANGYVLYILNPSGAHGYGQEFADLHANDWGTIATQDIIEGTEKVLAEHSYLDRNHIGATGGSYGGFITLDLMTKTDMFTTAIDMYGISNITSYFGGGTWGYWYGEIALPGSYPWTRPDVFVEKSPIFHADKIKTPLLILHGGGDINVPPLESDQMFVALKLLGRETTMIKFDDESHNINTKYENLIEHREMMLEWFNKYLKEQPAAWDDRMKRVPK